MNRRTLLTSLLALPFVPSMFRDEKIDPKPSKGWMELKGDTTGGIELILHEQTSTGYSFSCQIHE